MQFALGAGFSGLTQTVVETRQMIVRRRIVGIQFDGAPLRLIDPARYGYKSAKLITAIEFVAEGKGSMACDIGPYYSPGGEIKSGYDHPLDLGPNVRRKIGGGEIAEY